MGDQHDDPLRSEVQVIGNSKGDQSGREVASPTSPASHSSLSAPFMTPGSAMAVSDSRNHDTRSSRAASRQDGPRSSYFVGPPGPNSAFGTAPVGVIGRDKPREIVRIERDYSGGELCQFHPVFPLELEGRISPTTLSETINDINVIIINAHGAGWACFDNTLAVLSLYTSPFLLGSKYRREMKKLDKRIDEANAKHFNPAGLNLRKPIETAFLFLEVEYF